MTDALCLVITDLELGLKENDLPELESADIESPDLEVLSASSGVARETMEDLSVWYLRLVSRQSELISREDEVELAKRIEKGDRIAKRKLAQANLRLVINIAKRYAGRGAAFMDLIQEGNLGLMKAIDKFNYRLGYRFSTYATWWIKQSVFQAFAEHDRLIRLPGHVMDSVIKLRKARHSLKEQLGRPATDMELAQAMGVSLKKIQKLSQAAQRMMSLEAEVTLKDGNTQTLGDTIEDESLPEPGADLLQGISLDLLRLALLHHLDDRERDILLRRFGLSPANVSSLSSVKNAEKIVTKRKMTLEELGRMYGVTRECVRQTELRAIRKLRSSDFLQQLID